MKIELDKKKIKGLLSNQNSDNLREIAHLSNGIPVEIVRLLFHEYRIEEEECYCDNMGKRVKYYVAIIYNENNKHILWFKHNGVTLNTTLQFYGGL